LPNLKFFQIKIANKDALFENNESAKMMKIMFVRELYEKILLSKIKFFEKIAKFSFF
jgi:malonyl CoA-acyl carrier protein transacylase